MSKFLSNLFDELLPYVPGEQPQDKKYVKLNTNECPFAPTDKIAQIVNDDALQKLRLYPDPENGKLVDAIAENFRVEPKNVFVGNGSDEVLAFIFFAFFTGQNKVSFPDISYGFYPVYAKLFACQFEEIALKENFEIDFEKFLKTSNAIVFANPNAPTGIALSKAKIEKLLTENQNRLVVIDEAYVDFGGESVVELTKKYANLIVVSTMSKSRALAGARIGFAIANENLIDDIKKIKYSFNSYNVNRLSEEIGICAIKDEAYFEASCKKIVENREFTICELQKLGFEILPSKANFIFAKSNKIGGKAFYEKLKAKGILIRHFDKQRIQDYVRITIGTKEQMQSLVTATKEILKGE